MEAIKKAGLIEELAETLGEGWQGQTFSDGGSGILTGPDGSRVWVKPYLGEAELDVSILGGDPVPKIKQRVTVGEAFDFITQAIREVYPTWIEAHKADLKRQETLTAAQEAFAREVAGYLGEGWTGGTEGGWSSLKVFLKNGNLRIQWEPVQFAARGSHQMAARLTLRAAGGPSITVAANRTAKAIAGEIKRRLLPDYAAALRKTAEEEARHSQAVAGAASVAKVVEKTLRGMDPRASHPEHKGEQQRVSFYTNAGDVNLSGEVTCHEGGAYLKLQTGEMDVAAIKTLLGAITKAADKLREAAPKE